MLLTDYSSIDRKTLGNLLFYTIITSLAYFISARAVAPLSLSESSSIFAIWPPTGIALSFLLFRGYLVLPGIFLGAFFLNMTISSPLVGFEIAIGNTFGPAVAYWLIANSTVKNDIFYNTNTIMGFIFYSVIGAFITSSMGTTVLFLNGLLTSQNQLLGWAVWFFGDLIGFILIVPVFAAFFLQQNNSATSKENILETAFTLVVLVVSGIVIFGSGYFFDKRYPIEYLILFPLIWASIRLKYGINLIFLIIVTVFAILGTASGYSQFSYDGDHKLSLIMLQIFIFTVTFFILMMTAQRCQNIRILEEKEKLTLIDPLTQVGNRRFFTQVLKEELDKSRRYHYPISLIIFDIDHFKQINDTFGHIAGDSVLKELSALINGQLRSSDHLARWGGEEFTIVLPESHLSEGAVTAEKLRQAVENYPFSIKQHVTCSFGVTECSTDESVEDAIDRVDCKLYQAKETGRNKVVS
jgi:diguanylate cyclase (GGDEF)-like protein